MKPFITEADYLPLLTVSMSVDGMEKPLGIAFDSCTQAFGRTATYLSMKDRISPDLKAAGIGSFRPELQEDVKALDEMVGFGRRINGFATQMWQYAKGVSEKVRNDFDIFTTDGGEIAARRPIVRDMMLVAADLFDPSPDNARGAIRREIMSRTYEALGLGDLKKYLSTLDRPRAYAEVGLGGSQALALVSRAEAKATQERLTGFAGSGQLGDIARSLEDGHGHSKC